MAEQNPNNVPLPPEVDLKDELRDIKFELRSQNILKSVKDFDGEGSKRFRDWIKDLERVGTIVNADDDRYKAFALQTLKGSAADFLSRILKLHPRLTWRELKQILVQQYSDTADSQMAKSKLRRLAQKKGETIQNFAERIFHLADEAYIGHNMSDPLIQNVLVDTLIEGVASDAISRKLIRDRPNSLDNALAIAIKEQQDAKSFEIRRRIEEPMEIGMVQTQSRIDTLAQAMASMESKLDSILAVDNKPQFQPQNSSTQYNKVYKPQNRAPQYNKVYQWTQDHKPICYFCKKIGHIEKKCRMKRFTQKQNSKPQPLN